VLWLYMFEFLLWLWFIDLSFCKRWHRILFLWLRRCSILIS
jgi:hypothetical protein